MSTIFKTYLNTVETTLKAGNATEHTHRPTLKTLLEAIDPHITATNEPKQIACGAPDYIVTRDNFTIGYIEAKDVGKSLNDAERSDQLKRYRRALGNLILTDYLEFRWYVDGDLRQEARLAQVQSGGKLSVAKDGIETVAALLQNFLDHETEAVSNPKELAERMARLTHIIRDIIITAFETGQQSNLLQGWREAFAQVLIADLAQPERTADFADMVAQTLAYGLFSARLMDTSPENFTRHEAQNLIPKSNPFLRRFFARMTSIELDEEPFAPFVNDLVNLLAHTDMGAVLTDFGKRTRQEDPIVHFYETFLAAYDPKLREARGVYYTPEPVVSYIVRSVDYLLKTHFDCPQGLADSSKITVPNYDGSLKVQGKKETRKTTESHKVLVLDPATGTGTFLYAVIDHIRQQFMAQGNAGMWPGYVKNHLLPRLFGFELLMAPYAVAHFKLSLQLAGRDLHEAMADQWAYIPTDDERLGVYLTNTLEEAYETTGLPLFTQWVADETNAANDVKHRLPVLVVMGNPPYSVSSSNKSEWIEGLMDSYKQAVRGERNIQPLSDDYIKFIRFAQDRIERTEQGIVAIISNHTYLSGLIHRGMREELLKSFNEIYILDLHGNSLIRETTPEGSADKNVFDILQGVAIAIFVKTSKSNVTATIKHAELWGNREGKYDYLLENDISRTEWQNLVPTSPNYFFVPKDITFQDEYKQNRLITDIFRKYSTGFETGKDSELIKFSPGEITPLINSLANKDISDEEISRRYDIQNTSGWPVSRRRQTLMKEGFKQEYLRQVNYRPFDQRFTYYHGFLRRAQFDNLSHLCHRNMALITSRIIKGEVPNHVFSSVNPLEKIFLSPKTSNNAFVFPLYLYPSDDARKQTTMFDISPWPADAGNGGRMPNLDPTFVTEMAQKLGLTFQPFPDLTGFENLSGLTFSPEDIFHYIYAIFHSPTYRERYAEFLKIDFPRVPLTSDVALFRTLCAFGQELVSLHLLEAPTVSQFITRYPVAGDNTVAKGYPQYTPPKEDEAGRVYINKTQYFAGVAPELWAFQIGGYQVLDKWLKDRRGRALSYDELTHYQQTAVALQQTMAIMAKIDETIVEWPIV